MKDSLINKTIAFVQTELSGAESGHDWLHIERVYENALTIARETNCNIQIVQLGALLHDIADAKFYHGNEEEGPIRARKFLEENQFPDADVEHLIQIIRNISFRHSFQKKRFNSIELQIVQDADRLDAIGAIGIARAFSYGGHKGRPFYDDNIAPQHHLDTESYTNSTAPTINHFYEKLLLLKDMMQTAKGKKMAEERHAFMLSFLKQFDLERKGTK